jgi:hypothetical protein
MTFWRDWISWLLIAFALGCFVVGLFPQWSDWVDPASGDKVSERRHGFWFSPSYLYTHRELVQGGFTAKGTVNWLSWSSLVILIGVGSLQIVHWRRNASAGEQAQQPGVLPKQ